MSLLWLCCLLTLHQVTEEQDLLVLVKIAKFTYSGNCIIGHICDVDILGNLTAYRNTHCSAVVDNLQEQMSQKIVRVFLSGTSPTLLCFRAGIGLHILSCLWRSFSYRARNTLLF